MIAIILVMLLLVIVAVIAFNQFKSNHKLLADGQQELSAVQTAQFVTSLYELRCAKNGMKTACIDQYKAEAFKTLTTAQPLAYYTQLGYATITLDQVYPQTDTSDFPVTVYNETPSTIGYETVTLIIPIAIHNPIQDTLAFGTLTIRKYSEVAS